MVNSPLKAAVLGVRVKPPVPARRVVQEHMRKGKPRRNLLSVVGAAYGSRKKMSKEEAKAQLRWMVSNNCPRRVTRSYRIKDCVYDQLNGKHDDGLFYSAWSAE